MQAYFTHSNENADKILIVPSNTPQWCIFFGTAHCTRRRRRHQTTIPQKTEHFNLSLKRFLCVRSVFLCSNIALVHSSMLAGRVQRLTNSDINLFLSIANSREMDNNKKY